MSELGKKVKECINCPGKKVQARSLCNSCYDKYLKSVNPDYRKKQLENSKQWRKKNAEVVRAKEKARNLLRADDPDYKEKKRRAWLKRRYSISLEEFRQQLTSQNNACAICESALKEGDKFMHIDHSHNTGELRGILCSQCNWFMSYVDRNLSTLTNLINYVNNDGVWNKAD